MSAFEGQRLLGDSAATWTPKIVAGTIAGACVATALLSATSTSSLFTTPSTAVAQTTGVVSQPVFMTKPQQARTVAAAAPRDFQTEIPTGQSAPWAPLAAVAAVPMAVLAALVAMRAPKKAVLDPIDMMNAQGTQWTMMASAGEGAVARNYATALIELGQEGNCLEQLHSDMDNFGSLLEEDEEFSEFFSNPLLVGDAQKEIITGLCDEANMSPITKDFLCYLVDTKRIFQVKAIVKEFDNQFFEVTGTQVATVTAAVPLSEEELRLIANKLHELTEGRNIKIKSQVDESLLAGFVLEYGKNSSERIDLSLRGQLEELQEEMQEGIRAVLTEGVPAGVQLVATAVGINALLASSAHAAKGNIFDFGLTLPLQMIQFLLLMVFLEKVVFTPVGKIIDERAAYIRSKSASSADNTKEVAALNAQAEEILEAARRDASKKVEAAKKEANAKGEQMMASAKAEIEASLASGLAELDKAKEELWAKLEAEVLPELVEDIVSQLMNVEEDEEDKEPLEDDEESLEAAAAGAAE